VVGAIVGEFIGAQSGLGVLILQLDSSVDVGGSFAVFIILSLIGVALSAIIRAVETRVLYWLPKDQARRSINL
jgi:NitT/TauT family transport system permease protein